MRGNNSMPDHTKEATQMHTAYKSRRSQQGFTLIELLVVIAMISLLKNPVLL
jgi:prepilin-type N-terminal cleavage/methylation domain-containing protein